nr:hypothetical protein [Tanacetum cinerariifolium]
MSLLQEAMDACAALTRRVEHLEYNKVAQALKITKLKRRVKKLEKRNKGRMIAEMDQDDAIVLKDDKEEDKEVTDAVKDVKEAKVDESAQDQRRQAEYQAKIYKIDMDHANKLITEVVTAASETLTAASAIITTAEVQVPAATLTVAPARVAAAPSRRKKGVVIRDLEKESTTFIIIPAESKSKDKGKGILVEEPKPLKKKQQIEMDKEYARDLHAELNKDIDWDEAIDHVKRKAKEDLDSERAAKRRKLDEEVEDLKRHLQTVPNEDDDVYTEATPLARKVPVVDYEIIEINNKPYYKIIRANETHQLHISFLTLLRTLTERTWRLYEVCFGNDAAMDLKKKHAKCLMLLVKNLVLPSKVDAFG